MRKPKGLTDSQAQKLAEQMYDAGFYAVNGCFDVSKQTFIELLSFSITEERNPFDDYRRICNLFAMCEEHNRVLSLEQISFAEMFINGDLCREPAEHATLELLATVGYSKKIHESNAAYENARIAANLYISRPDVRLRIFTKCNNACMKCNTTEDLSIDHIISVKNGGSNEDDNLQVLCRSCNSKKGAK